MNRPVISVRNLGKRYQLGRGGAHDTLRDQIAHGIGRLFQSKIKNQKSKVAGDESFWALKDVSFDVEPGEVIGIIGRNGAGKSTLLKVLSQITEPTEGEVRVRGRVASLLEVGTGFHPELSGRENIFLNGAILGMTKSEIRRKFDEIVAFAEVEKFLDTPIKRYSSGMYVRLAFAVAAHLEPEILIVDEVLAVGDIEFQKKCLGKMGDIANREGRTVLFVSHNMNAIQSLCSRGIFLEHGHLKLDSNIQAAVDLYLHKSRSFLQTASLGERKDRSGSGKAKFCGFRVLDSGGCEAPVLQSGNDYVFELEYKNFTGKPMDDAVFSIDINDENNTRILLFRSNFTNHKLRLEANGGCIQCSVPDFPLANGSYKIALFMSYADREIVDYLEEAALVTVNGGDFYGTGSYGLPSHCKVLTRTSWQTTTRQG